MKRYLVCEYHSKFHAEMLNRIWEIWNFLNQCCQTRMHSSRMRTICSSGCLLGGGMLGCLLPGGCLLLGGVSHHALRQTPPPPCGQTDACKNITFATSLQMVKIGFYTISWKRSYIVYRLKTVYVLSIEMHQLNLYSCGWLKAIA